VGWWRLIKVEGRRDQESEVVPSDSAAEEPAT
jgi:hypothetical protein